MSRYIPPALRRKVAQETGPEETSGADASLSAADTPTRSLAVLSVTSATSESHQTHPFTLDEIHNFYVPRDDSEDFSNSFNSCSRSSLNNSVGIPNGLAYVLLFPNANPKWDSDCLIYAKSNLWLLPGFDGVVARGWNGSSKHRARNPTNRTEADGEHPMDEIATNSPVDQTKSSIKVAAADRPSLSILDNSNTIDSEESFITVIPPADSSQFEEPHPIPIFQQILHGFRNVKFIGYYTIQQVAWLRPRSKSLVYMLETKFGGTVTSEATSPGSSKTNSNEGNVVLEQDADASTTSPQSKSKDKSRRETGPKARSAEAWQGSLSTLWAVIKMKPITKTNGITDTDEQGDDTKLLPPPIERHPEDDRNSQAAERPCQATIHAMGDA